MSGLLRVWIGGLVVAALGAGWAAAQDEGGRRGFSSMLNIDALIDNHARMLARRYNLTPEQDQYTQDFLKAKCDEFLAQHRDELFALVDRMFEVRSGGEMDATELAQWGKKALPLYEQAKQIIIEGNAQWREILTDEQRKIHDEDLRQMYESFAGTEEQLQRIVTGQMTVDEFRRGDRLDRPARRGAGPRTLTPAPVMPAPPPAQPGGGVTSPPPAKDATPAKPGGGPPNPRTRTPGRPEPVPAPPGVVAAPNPTPTPPAPGGVVNAPGGRIPRGAVANPAAANAGYEGQWEAYVREFIQRYQLDEAQSQKANSILKECQDQARGYMSRRKADFDRLDERLKSLGSEPDKAKAMQDIQQQRQKLLEPVGRIFEKQLKPRLERLPTRAQRQAAEAAGKAPPGKAGATPGKGSSGPGGGRPPTPGPKPVGPAPSPPGPTPNPPIPNPPAPPPEMPPEVPPEIPPEMPPDEPGE